MRSASYTGSRDPSFRGGPSALNVLLLYEDAVTGVRAKLLVDQLVEHVNLIVSFHLSLCRFDMLSIPALRQLDPEESLSSDILVIAAHGHDDLPQGVRAWLERWFARNPEGSRALALSLDDRARGSSHANQIQHSLQAAGSRAGVEVFSHFGETQYSELDSAIAGIRYRAETTSMLMDEALHRSGSRSFRYWGIND